MNLKEYQEKARSTAIYDYKKMGMVYPGLGLMGECGEIAEKIKKLFRDDNGDFTDERKQAVVKELGDCTWYLANVCCDTDHDLLMTYKMRNASQMRKAEMMHLPQLVFHMGECAARIYVQLEEWYYRYGTSPAEHERFTDIPHNVTMLLVCVEEMATRCNSTLENVYSSNIEKLLSRKKRGVLKGDGDNR